MNGNGTITRSSPAQVAFANVAHFIATEAGRPLAFLFALTIVIIWAATGPIFHYSDSWLLVINTGTSIVTALMVFLIQKLSKSAQCGVTSKARRTYSSQRG